MKVKINTDGTVKLLYTEDIPIEELGEVTSIKRASYIEPTDNGKWIASMEPSGGPMLGPFNKRSEAISAEIEWLNNNVLA